jgi:hypothetical protein
MIISPTSIRLLSAFGACALTFSLAACTDNNLSPENIPPSASTGPGNAFSPGEGVPGGGADVGFPSNGGGSGANAPGH